MYRFTRNSGVINVYGAVAYTHKYFRTTATFTLLSAISTIGTITVIAIGSICKKNKTMSLDGAAVKRLSTNLFIAARYSCLSRMRQLYTLSILLIAAHKR